ncbi:MAG: diacylglycerol kinase family protein [Anaerolineae bacterium]
MSENRALLVVNPIRRPKGGKQLTGILDAVERLGVHCALKFTEHKGHGMELASRGVAEGYRTIVAVGGDGTVNEVVNGVAGSEAAVFSIPVGAGNDFLRSIGIWTWEEACCVLAEGHFTHVDLGLAEYQDDAGQRKQRYYAVLADVGFGSEVVDNAPRRFRHALGGGLGYVVGLYRTGTYGHSRARRMKVRVEGELRYDEELLLVEALNGMYAGGGLKVAPKAKLNDGLLDVFLVRDMPWLKIWGLFPKVYWGTHIEHERAEYFPVREVEVEAEKSTRVSVDGEVIGYAPARFRVVPGGLKTVCPPETASGQVAKGI